MRNKVFLSHLDPSRKVSLRPGIDRVTMSYNEQNMLCYFFLKKGAKLELHSHEAVQNGFVIKGRILFFKEDGSSVEVKSGDGYIFDSHEPHGSEVLEDSEFVECFSPMRPEYAV